MTNITHTVKDNILTLVMRSSTPEEYIPQLLGGMHNSELARYSEILKRKYILDYSSQKYKREDNDDYITLTCKIKVITIKP